MLAEQVAAGTLPPVEERLPKNPVVVDENYFAEGTMDAWQPGTYGGEMRVSHNEPNNAPDVFFMVMQPIIRLQNTLSDGEMMDNICLFLGNNEDATEFTFQIREGLKWSDGVPVTTEDVRFAYEDITLNKDVWPSTLGWCTSDGVAAELTIVDDLTFKFTFHQTTGSFLRTIMLSNWVEYTRIIKPAHYLKQFHKDYATPEELTALCAEAGYPADDWHKLIIDKDTADRAITSRNAMGIPVLNPFVLTQIANEVYVYERNPYYFKVDSEGKQLPYLDRIVSPKVQDGEMENMRMIAGEADILRRNAALLKLPLYKANEAAGDYTTLIREQHLSVPSMLMFEYQFGTESDQAVVADKRFRLAVSHGINRQEIIDVVYLGMGELPTLIPSEFDPDKANALLDEMGMAIGADGWRTAPGGEPYALLIETGNEAVDLLPSIEIAASHLREYLKLNASIRSNDTTLFSQAGAAGLIQCRTLWAFDAMAVDEYTTRWMPGSWNRWNTNRLIGEAPDFNGGIEPPEWAMEGFALRSEINMLVFGTEEYAVNLEKQKAFFYDNVPAIPLLQRSKLPIPLANKFGNVQSGGYQITLLMSVEQMFIK